MSDKPNSEREVPRNSVEGETRRVAPDQNESSKPERELSPEAQAEILEDSPRANESYTANDMEHLSDLEHVRRRPSMYIGDVSSMGLHHLVNEVVDNSLDEALAGYATHISVTINSDGSITVEDDGRGIPVDVYPELGYSTLQGVMTVLKFGGKFSKGAYQTSGGLHGVGVTVVNFLSEWCNVEVFRDGYSWYQEYERGVPTGDVVRGAKTEKHGTKTTFKPDGDIFADTKFKYDVLYGRLQDLAFLNPNIYIKFSDLRDGRGEEFHYKNGIIDFVHNLNGKINDGKVEQQDVFYAHGEQNGVRVDVAFQYSTGYEETVRTYANNVHTIEGGSHLTGFRRALTSTLTKYGNANGSFRNITPENSDFREGVTAVISVRVPQPDFQGQTKTRLGNAEVEGIVATIVGSQLQTYLEKNPETAKIIMNKVCLAAEARESARKKREEVRKRKDLLNSAGMPGKLRDCTSRDYDNCEIYLVEGNSAGGSAEGGRIREFQAILPLRGKVINAYKTTDLRVLKNEEIRSMIVAFGVGYGEHVDLTKRRYGKVVIMTDADVDGSHIRTLLLTFFYRQMNDLVKAGFVYAAQPPLYRVRRKNNRDGKARYVMTDQDMKRELLLAGVQNARFDARDGRVFEGERLEKLCELLGKIEDSVQTLERRGFSLRALAYRQDPVTGALPRFHVTWRKVENWFFKPEELDAYLAQIQQETGLSLDDLKAPTLSKALDQKKGRKKGGEKNQNEEQNAEQRKDFDENADVDARPRIVEIYEMRTLNGLLKDLREKYLFEIDSLFPIERTGQEGSRYALSRGDSTTGVEDLRSLLTTIRNAGEKGWQITRFKGLGEMDPEELRETTLDPVNRTLVQITMEDANAASKTFDVLMGEDVEPRRKFIEKFALDAKLDV